jgi:hypothetical protein
MAGFAALKDVDRAAGAGETPADGQPNGAAANDRDARTSSGKREVRVDGGLPSLVLPRQVPWV